MQQYEKIFSYLTEKALQYRYDVTPNPCVGAALLLNDTILAEGYHQKFGGMHAEIHCISQIKDPELLKKATLVVTLEPCTHHGKTPPCVNAIIESGIQHVVFGAKDTTSVACGGASILQQHGIHTEFVDSPAARYCLQNFTAWNTRKIPHVIIKLATSLDGYIATRTNHSQWISNQTAQEFVQQLRYNIARNNGAILIGANTLRIDNPRLTVRTIPTQKQPKVIIFARSLHNTLHCTLFQQRPSDCILFTTDTASIEATVLAKKGVTVLNAPHKNNIFHIASILQKLYTDFSIPYILCEGGGMLFHSLLQEQIPLELYHITAPLIFGDTNAVAMAQGNTLYKVDDAYRLSLHKVENLAGNILATYSSL